MEGGHHEDIWDSIERDDGPRRLPGPVKIMLSFGLALMIILMVVPAYNLKVDPPPRHIPSFSDVVPAGLPIASPAPAILTRADYLARITPSDPVVKRVADKIASQSCPAGATTCQARAIFSFVQDEFSYVSDPVAYEYVKTPVESFANAAGDCDDASVLLASLLQAIGIQTRFVFIPGHVYVQAKIPDAPRRYKDGFGWIDLDPTCRDCEFGQVPYTTAHVQKEFVG